MRIAYFDCFSGASGDMVLGALVDAGVGLEEMKSQLALLGLQEFNISAAKATRLGITGIKVGVHLEQAHAPKHSEHRGLSDVLAIIDSSGLSPKVKADASAVFQRLAEAEAKVHDTTPDEVHFHEVGAVDAIVDVVGACIGLELLGVERILVSPIRTGTGYVTCAHGRMAVPVPATVELLKDFPTVGADVPHELTTPTGAAILSTLGAPAHARPAMQSYKVGYGAGGRDNEELANMLRLFVGEQPDADAEDEVWVVETNLDDISPEIVAHACERIFAAGAIEVFTCPITMKKGRQGVLLRALAAQDKLIAVEDAIFAETTTLGVRRHMVQRTKLHRTWDTVATPYGDVRVKVASRGHEVLTAAPEYEDCRAAAASSGAPLKAVYGAAMAAYRTRVS